MRSLPISEGWWMLWLHLQVRFCYFLASQACLSTEGWKMFQNYLVVIVWRNGQVLGDMCSFHIAWGPKVRNSFIPCQMKSYRLFQSSGKTAASSAAPSGQIPAEPWEELGIDVVGPLETAAWNCWFGPDTYGKWPEVAFMASVTAGNVIILNISLQ